MQRSILTIVVTTSLLVPTLALADDDGPRRPTKIQVHVDANRPVTVQERVDGAWIDRCASPCDRDLSADGEFRIGGDAVRNSRSFTLERDTHHVDVSVHASTALQHGGGIALGVLGGAAVLTGTVMVVIGSFQTSVPSLGAAQAPIVGVLFYPSSTTVGPNHDLMIAGGITIGGGVLFAIAGIALATTATTTVVQRAQPLTPLADAAVAPRSPTWREPAAGPAEIGRPWLVPIYSGRF